MKRWINSVSIGLVFLFLISACSGKSGSASPTVGPPVELIVSAAASLTDALNELQGKYEAAHKTVKLKFNFGASGALQQQIEQGAPADLFLSAAARNMKTLVDKQLIDAAHTKNMLLNDLVVVVPAEEKSPIQTIQQLTEAKIKYLAIGAPQTVPAGSYAMEALNSIKLWEAVQPKVVQGKDVRQVLTYVETGNAEAGFVYKTDAMTSTKVKVAFAVDPTTYKPVEYPAGIVKATKHAQEASEFYKYLFSAEAQSVFVKYGFSLPK